jgi:RNA polymerase sigma-70 factor (ECF subfamily)
LTTTKQDISQKPLRAAEDEKKKAEKQLDMDLVLKAQAGDYESFEQLVSRHSAKTYALALGMLRNNSDAEEVVQDTFLNVFQRLNTFRGDSAFTSWLYRIAANNALMRLRKRKREPVDSIETMLPTFHEDGNHTHMPGTWAARSADKLVDDKELAKILEDALAKLPAQYRVVLLMRDVDGLSNEEISDVMGLSIPAVKSRLHRARLAVREELDRRYTRK